MGHKQYSNQFLMHWARAVEGAEQEEVTGCNGKD